MGLIVGAETNENKRTMVPEGTHVARCINYIDLGRADSEWEGKITKKKRVVLTFEFPEHKAVFREEDGPQPLGRTITYTNTLKEKSNLKKDLQTWRGKAFTAQEILGFDLDNVLGHPCQALVLHEPKKDGTTRDKIKGLSKMPDSLQAPPPSCQPWKYEIETHPKNFDKVPAWCKEEILNSDTYKALHGDQAETQTEVKTNEVPF